VGGTFGANEGQGKAYKLLVRKPEGKRSLGRRALRRVDAIKFDSLEMDWVLWTGLVWLRMGTGGELL
jgi:hypothetical protein